MESYRIFKPVNPNSSGDFCILNEVEIMPEEALHKVGPKSYQLSGHGEQVRILLFGCQGDELSGQATVAQLMNQIAGTHKPDLAIVLGDNIYENGASSPVDQAFKVKFYDMYLTPQLTHLQQFPYFLILGNHDGNYHKKANWAKLFKTIQQGWEVEKNQVIHTYTTNAYGNTADKINHYQQSELNIKELQPWNMPYFYYSLIIGNVQIFCINSNCYPREYLYFLTGDFNENNQAAWFAKEYSIAKQNNRKIILALHHPLQTEGKRIEPDEFDAHQYFANADEIELLNKYLKSNTNSYSELLKLIFIHQEMKFDLILSAHDHYLSYYNNQTDPDADYKIRQLKPGGGGGRLQKRVAAKDHPYVACCLENHGFATITFYSSNAEVFDIDIYSTQYHHLKFDNKSHLAIRTEYAGIVEQLRHFVLSACHDYLTLLKQQELQQAQMALAKKNDNGMISYFVSSMNSWIKYVIPYPVKIKEMTAADSLKAYFSQYTLPSLDELLNFIINSIDANKLKLFFTYLKKYELDKISDPQLENSFYFLLFKKMIAVPEGLGDEMKARWERLIQSPTKRIQPMPIHIINGM